MDSYEIIKEPGFADEWRGPFTCNDCGCVYRLMANRILIEVERSANYYRQQHFVVCPRCHVRMSIPRYHTGVNNEDYCTTSYSKNE